MKTKRTTQAKAKPGALRARQLIPLALSALIAAPNSPLVASVAAQTFSASEAGVGAAASVSAGASVFVGASHVAAPTVLPSLASPLSAPSFSAIASGPAALAPAAAASAAPAHASVSAAAASVLPASAVPSAVSAAAVSVAAPAAEARTVPQAASAPAGRVSLSAAAHDGASAKAAPPAGASDEKAAAPALDDAGLARLFDGAKGYSADSVSVALTRADGAPVATTLAELGRVLQADPSLLKSLNAGGSVKLVLKSEVGARVPKTVAADLTGYLRERGISAPVDYARKSTSWVGFDWALLKSAPKLLRESWTVPNKQDYTYLAAKTFGLNLAVRAFFAVTAVHHGDLPLMRALISTSWYQFQDAGFTLFGQTYMKFIGRMTGLLRIGRSYFGDFLFTYGQLTAFEFLNRLVLGPIGENPLVYSPHGLALIFANVFMGMISGGPLIPAISKMRRAGVISQSTMMNLYQLASLTMQFGLLASFGYQHLYFMLTTATLVLSWGSYAFFTLFYKDKPGIDTGMGGGEKKP